MKWFVRTYLAVLQLVCFSVVLPAQVKTDIKFVKHLDETGKNDEITTYLNHRLDRFTNSGLQADTLVYYLGWGHYRNKQFQKADSVFSINTELRMEPRSYYHAMTNSYLGNHQKAHRILKAHKHSQKPGENLTKLLLSGNYLLNRSFHQFDSLQSTIGRIPAELRYHQEALVKAKQDYVAQKKRSPLVAGLLSAVVPGAGKVYAGKMGEGIVSFLVTGAFAASGIEQYLNGGFGNPQFYIFGSLATIFYAGGIAGSVYSVKVANIESYESFKSTVLFHMHIPVHTIFR